jgi:hypothetical protein
MMYPFRKIESFFLALGATLLILSAYTLISDKTFFKLDLGSSADPFQGTYEPATPVAQSVVPKQTRNELHIPEPSLKDMLTVPVDIKTGQPETKTETTSLNTTAKEKQLSERFRTFLMAPKSQQIFRWSSTHLKVYPIYFRFEVFPKEAVSTLEIYQTGKLTHSNTFQDSKNGIYEYKILFKAPGLYQWRVNSGSHLGDFRSFTIQP